MITFSLSCSFFHLGEKNLVVAGADVLRVFQMVPEVTSNTCRLCRLSQDQLLDFFSLPKAMSEPSSEGEGVEPRLKLECVASWKLFGWVQVRVLVLKLHTCPG